MTHLLSRSLTFLQRIAYYGRGYQSSCYAMKLHPRNATSKPFLRDAFSISFTMPNLTSNEGNNSKPTESEKKINPSEEENIFEDLDLEHISRARKRARANTGVETWVKSLGIEVISLTEHRLDIPAFRMYKALEYVADPEMCLDICLRMSSILITEREKKQGNMRTNLRMNTKVSLVNLQKALRTFYAICDKKYLIDEKIIYAYVFWKDVNLYQASYMCFYASYLGNFNTVLKYMLLALKETSHGPLMFIMFAKLIMRGTKFSITNMERYQIEQDVRKKFRLACNGMYEKDIPDQSAYRWEWEDESNG